MSYFHYILVCSYSFSLPLPRIHVLIPTFYYTLSLSLLSPPHAVQFLPSCPLCACTKASRSPSIHVHLFVQSTIYYICTVCRYIES